MLLLSHIIRVIYSSLCSCRVCYEGVPISEQFQNNRTDGIHFLPPHTSKSLTGCQKFAEYCLKKPQLQLLGKKVRNNFNKCVLYMHNPTNEDTKSGGKKKSFLFFFFNCHATKEQNTLEIKFC